MSNEAFLSGSRRYGYPTANSDVDLIIKVHSQDEALRLMLLLDDSIEGENGSDTIEGSLGFKHGKLNLIICWTQEAYDIWHRGTYDLYKIRPVTRAIAVDYFRRLRGLGH